MIALSPTTNDVTPNAARASWSLEPRLALDQHRPYLQPILHVCPGVTPVQVAALCRLPSGGVPATYLSSQQSKGDSDGVYNELKKVRGGCLTLPLTL